METLTRIKEAHGVISNAFRCAIWMRCFKKSYTSYLELFLLSMHHDLFVLMVIHVVDIHQHLLQHILLKYLKWTAVHLVDCRRCKANYLGATPSFVVLSFAFLSVHVPDIVSIVLFESFTWNLLTKLSLPKYDRLINSHPKSLYKVSQL